VTAVVLSPAVHRQIVQDSTVNEFYFEDERVTVSIVSALIGFIHGNSIDFSRIDGKSILSLCQDLENVPLEQFIFSIYFGGLSSTIVSISECDDNCFSICASKFYSYSKTDL
jgi:hypothetical protein